MSLSPRNKANLKLSSLSSTSSHHHSQSPKAKPLVACHHRGGARRSSDANDDEAEGKSQWTSDQHHPARSKTDWDSQECSMCGDVGFPTELFQCKKCLHRFQHMYCSRYYPSLPELDVCDWCSQDVNRSAGSSTATTTITGTSMKTTRISKPPPRTLITNLGKRKVIAAAQGYDSPSSSSPRKNCSSELHHKSPKKINSNNNNLKSSNNNMINTTTTTTTTKSSAQGDRNSNYRKISEVEEHKDALVVLLEVAQKVAEGQMINTWSSGDGGIGVDKTSICWDNTKQDVQHKQKQQKQQHHQTQAEQGLVSRNSNMTAFNKSSKAGCTIQGSLLLPASTKKQKLDNLTGSASVSSGVGDGFKHQVGAASASGTKVHKLQLTNSRSIGRRYKLLSDVLCPKVAASNS